DIAVVVAKDAGYRPGAVRYRIIHAPGSAIQTPAWTTQSLRNQNNTRSNPAFTRNRSQIDTLWQGAADSLAHSGRSSTFFERRASTFGLVRILRCRQTALVKNPPAAGNRNSVGCRRNTPSIRADRKSTRLNSSHVKI